MCTSLFLTCFLTYSASKVEFVIRQLNSHMKCQCKHARGIASNLPFSIYCTPTLWVWMRAIRSMFMSTALFVYFVGPFLAHTHIVTK